MSFKTILAATSGGPASDGAVEFACRLASGFDAHLEGFHVRMDPLAIFSLAADGFDVPLSDDWIEQINIETATLAKKANAVFESAVARSGLGTGAVSWREEVGHGPTLVADRARFFDLAVLGRSERVVERPHTDTVEETLLRSGRPVLLAPARVPPTIGETIAVGWNGSAEAVRALTGSLPLLRAASRVEIIAVGEDKRAAVYSVTDYLDRHGITARHREIERVSNVGIGEQLLDAAEEIGADFLVMGGYGHAPWREFVFGGATRTIVGTGVLPLLLMH